MARQRLSAVVMTHPKRRAAAEKLALSAPSGLLRVVMDPDPTGTPSVLRTALAAWSAIEDGATHQLVIQDDMLLSDSFFDRVRCAIEELPDSALALFALWDSRNGAAVRFGAMAGARWVGSVNEYFPCVAIVLPRRVAEGFVAYGRERLGGWPDDILMYRYLCANGVSRHVAVPNLAEHEDRGSISGNAFRGPRRSVCYLPGDGVGDEGRTLSGLTVIPFFKYGVAKCAVRADGPGPERWLHLDAEQYLRGTGLSPRCSVRPAAARGRPMYEGPGSRLSRWGSSRPAPDSTCCPRHPRPTRRRWRRSGRAASATPVRRSTSPGAGSPWPRWRSWRSRPGTRRPPGTGHAPGGRADSCGAGRRTRSANTSHAGWRTGGSGPQP